MLKSMTGFGAAAVENDDYKVTVELKAVNQRFFGNELPYAPAVWAVGGKSASAYPQRCSPWQGGYFHQLCG